ncbi:MAG: hypothetical protein AAB541_01765 [Patescibacteria group bacterium]
MPPVLQHEFHEHKGRRWPVTSMYIVLAFLVAVAIVSAGRWIYRKTTHNNLPVAAPTDNQQPSLSGATSSPASSSPAPGAGQNQTASQLPNNGPGDVAAIFVGVALAVGGLHFLYNLRKQN